MIDNVRERYPQIKVVATTLREVHSTNRHTWGAVAWIDGKTHVAPTCELDVYDRVGGGDGFAAGLFFGLLSGETPQEARQARLGTRRDDDRLPGRHHDGDSLDQVRAFAQGRIGADSAVAAATGLEVRRSCVCRGVTTRRAGLQPRRIAGQPHAFRRSYTYRLS